MAEREPPTGEPIRITAEEIAKVVAPPPRVVPPSYVAAAADAGPRVSRLAVASLVLAGLGIPLVGCLLGPIAIGCGAVALSRIEARSALKGFGIALGGV